MDHKTLHENFGDVIDILDEPQFGVLAGDAAHKHFRLSWHIGPDGPYLRLRCTQCGTQIHAFPDWDELLICAHGMCPVDMQTHENYKVIDGYFVMPVKCRSCGAPVPTARFTKDEAERQIAQGMKSGAISPQWVKQRSAEISAQMQRYQGGTPMMR